MRRSGVWVAVLVLSGGALSACLMRTSPEEDARIQRGNEISPVEVETAGRDRELLGLGSYVVNAEGGCNDCHTCPSFVPGKNPFQGGDGTVNSVNFLAGGTPFGPDMRSPNLTPDEVGRPGGLSYGDFLIAMRLGHDPNNPDEILQVMPWPVYRNMGERDLRAVYEYLRSIPPAEPGQCSGPGE